MDSLQLTRRGFVAGSLALGVSLVCNTAQAANVSKLVRGDAIKWNGTVINLDPLKKFYRGKLGKGIWTGRQGLSKKGQELVKVLQNASADGLEPREYLSALPPNYQQLTGNDLAAAELYLSQSFWKFARDLSSGRTTPAVSEPDIVISRKKTDIRGWLKLASRKGPTKVV
ncbi:MAG: hypothetical protein AAF478_06725, partial [Pseudomonadota bacterium]